MINRSNIGDHFKSEELIHILKKLVEINSENPPGVEGPVAFYIKQVLYENGIPAELSEAAPKRPNVKAVLKGKKPGPTVIYNGHLDVVPAGQGWTRHPNGAVIEDGKLYGRGAADMKSGLAAMMYAAIVLKRMGLPLSGTLILYFNVDEERSNIGMKHFLNENFTADYAIISEPTDLDVCIGHKGVARYRLRTFGTAGHTSVVRQPDNAIYKMTKLILALENLSTKIQTRKHPLLGTASLTVTQIIGGTAPNIVPSETIIEIDRRIVPGETEKGVYEEIERTVSEVAQRGQFSYVLEQYLYLPPYIIAEDHPLVSAATSIVNMVTNREKCTKPFIASTEAPFFAVYKEIPTLILGPGSLKQAHTVDEHVEITEVIAAAHVFIILACQLLSNNDQAIR